MSNEALDQLKIDRSKAKQGPSRLIWVLLALIVVGGLIAYWHFQGQSSAVAVRTITLALPVTGAQDSGETLLNATGYVTARRTATVSSKVMGKVMEVLVEEGMKVEEGQVLAKLDASNVITSLELAKAQLDSSRKGLDETNALLSRAESELRRASKLVETNAGSISSLDQAEADERSLRARLDRQAADVVVAQREVATWQQQVEDNVIRAPFAGVVTSKNAQPGEMISPMSSGGFTRTGICTIVDMSSLEIEVDVNESYINRVEPQQLVSAKLDAYPNWEIPAKVIAVIPTADRQKATVRVRVGFDELDPRILPEMGVKVAFQKALAATPTKISPGVWIPKNAVQKLDNHDVVWLVKNGRIERRAISLGDERGDQIKAISGLNGGEIVVIDGPSDLAEGMKIKEEK